MVTGFRIVALPSEPFAPLFALDETALAARGASRCIADAKPGFPCRVSLLDAEPGEPLILLQYTHHDTDGPYRASGPIFVRVGAERAIPEPNEVPESVRGRLLSFRGYDATGQMLEAEVAQGTELESVVNRFFADPRITYIHLHNARPGCYNCRVERLPGSVTVRGQVLELQPIWIDPSAWRGRGTIGRAPAVGA